MQGMDYEEVLLQRKYECDLFKEYGLPLPEWAGPAAVPGQAQQGAAADKKATPKKPEAK